MNYSAHSNLTAVTAIHVTFYKIVKGADRYPRAAELSLRMNLPYDNKDLFIRKVKPIYSKMMLGY
ncbi:MAG: hypothetical protein ACI4NE_01635 [Succinivibrio sp.]